MVAIVASPDDAFARELEDIIPAHRKRPRLPDEACALCEAAPGERCANVFTGKAQSWAHAQPLGGGR
jgi:hypothetical protein